MLRTSGMSFVTIHNFSSGLPKHSVLMFLTSSMVYSFCSLHFSFSFKKSRMTKYKLHMSSLLDKSYYDSYLTDATYQLICLTILLCAFKDANDTVPLKSAFFLCATGFKCSSRCFFASPKSTI